MLQKLSIFNNNLQITVKKIFQSVMINLYKKIIVNYFHKRHLFTQKVIILKFTPNMVHEFIINLSKLISLRI